MGRVIIGQRLIYLQKKFDELDEATQEVIRNYLDEIETMIEEVKNGSN